MRRGSANDQGYCMAGRCWRGFRPGTRPGLRPGRGQASASRVPGLRGCHVQMPWLAFLALKCEDGCGSGVVPLVTACAVVP